MKRTVVAALVAAVAPLAVWAEGYQVNTLSAKQNGMGHTGTALHLGAESQIFNPAGMGWLDKNFELSASVSPIFATGEATLKSDGRKYETDNTAATPMSVNVGFSIYDNLKAGIAFYTPYGSSINWTDNWPGADLNQSVDLKTFTIQPTIAWRIIPNLSVGAGLMVTWGNVNLNKGLVSPQGFDAMMQQMIPGFPSIGNTVPASVNLSGKAHPRVGVNVGVMYDINEQWTVGANFRSEMMMKVKAGEATMKYASVEIENILEPTLGIINTAEFKAQMPCAAVYSAGVSYRPVKPLVIAFDAQFTQWSAYKQLDIEFLNTNLTAFNQNIPKNYHNSWTFHLGAQYDLSKRFDVRAGLMLDTTPVDKNHYNPETPGMTKIEPSIGCSFRPLDYLSIDFGLLYVAGLGADNRSCTYRDFILGEKTFVADYSVHAFCPSIGVTLSL
ncbi:MAG: aromatic hydrocarbon degradation protein [Bacteroidales bacterium]|nr:aromatic hydrocarbon degradation protein [Bacteroidales bacterium]